MMLGSTVPTVGGLHNAFRWGEEWGCECIQIYITPSRRWEVSELSEDEVLKFRNSWQMSVVREVVAHVPYLVNLASGREDLIQRSITRLHVELSRAERLGVKLLILHPGSYGTLKKQDGIRNVISALNDVFEDVNGTIKVLLETMAGQGTAIGSCFEEISYILGGVHRTELVGVCIDTGHLFMAGYDIRGYDGWDSVTQQFDEIVGLEKVMAIHLNDSRVDLSSRIDRHACIGEGKMGLQTFHAILKDPRFVDVPKLLEIPGWGHKAKDKEVLALLRVLQTLPRPIQESELRSQFNDQTCEKLLKDGSISL